MSEATSPLGGDDLAKAMRDAYGRGFSQSGEGYNGEYPGDAHEKQSWRNERDAWIRQYMARMPAAVPSVRDGEEVRRLERVRHVKRGTEYEVLGEAEAQVSYDRIGAAHRVGRPLWDECRLTVYRCAETGKLWARFTDEFRDGRFKTIAAAPVSSTGDGDGWLPMKDAPTGVPIIAKHKPNAQMPQGWVATIKLGHGDDEEAGCYDTILHYNGEESFRGFRGIWTGWLPMGSAIPAGSAGSELEQVSLADGDWAYERAKDIREKWMATAFMTGGDFALPAGHLSDMAEALRHAHAAGYTIGHEAGDKYRSGKLVLASGSGEEKGETLETIAAWCEQTFGPVEPARIAKRAAEEMDELLAEPTKVEEAADVVIVLSRYPGLWEAVERKMAVNRARKWRLMGDGTGYHVKAETPEPSPQSSPTLKTGVMTVEEAKEVLDNLPAGMEPEDYMMVLRARAANVEAYPFVSTQLRAEVSRIETALRTLQDSGEVRS